MDLPTEMPSILAMADLATPMSIRVAATLGLVERAGGAGATAERLAAETGTATPVLRRLLDHLVTIGVFDHDAGSGRYRPTGLGARLRADDPEGLTPLLDINSAGGRAELGFVELLGTITTGTPGYVLRYGRDFWTDLDCSPELRRSFDAQMNWRFQVRAPQIAERFDWHRFPEILDVGGGDGTVLTAILHAHPGVRGRVLDAAPTTAAATARFAAAGLGERAGVVAGSFFDPLPSGADAYLLRRPGTDGGRAGPAGRRFRAGAARLGSGGRRAHGAGVRRRARLTGAGPTSRRPAPARDRRSAGTAGRGRAGAARSGRTGRTRCCAGSRTG